MPRHTSKSSGLAATRSQERNIRVEKETWWQAVKRFVQDKRTRTVAGIILFSFAVIAALSYVSFLCAFNDTRRESN